MPPNVNNNNSYISKLKTIVAAPGIKQAQTMGSKVHTKTELAVQKIPMPVWLRPFAVSFIITTGVTLTVVGVWVLGNLMIKSITSISLPKIEVPNFPSTQNPDGVINNNRSIEEVFSRLQELEISQVVFTKTVDERFYSIRPGLNGRELTDQPQDQALRQAWHSTANDLLNKIEQANLSQTARRKIGSFSQRDSLRWDRLAKAGKLGKYRSFQDLRVQTYQKFEPLFPGQERGKLNQQTYLQIWYAIASDQVGNK